MMIRGKKLFFEVFFWKEALLQNKLFKLIM